MAGTVRECNRPDARMPCPGGHGPQV